MSTVHHQEYLNTAYTQQVFAMLVLLASASRRQENSLPFIIRITETNCDDT